MKQRSHRGHREAFGKWPNTRVRKNHRGYPNGTKSRKFKTRRGELDLLVPQLRNCEPYHPSCSGRRLWRPVASRRRVTGRQGREEGRSDGSSEFHRTCAALLIGWTDLLVFAFIGSHLRLKLFSIFFSVSRVPRWLHLLFAANNFSGKSPVRQFWLTCI